MKNICRNCNVYEFGVLKVRKYVKLALTMCKKKKYEAQKKKHFYLMNSKTQAALNSRRYTFSTTVVYKTKNQQHTLC